MSRAAVLASIALVATFGLGGCSRPSTSAAPPAPGSISAEAGISMVRPASLRPADAPVGCAAPYAAGPVVLPNSAFSGSGSDVLIADVDNDGNLDIISSNGNDVSKGDVHVLFGPFDGGAPSATWSSDAGNYYRRLAVGDIDGDGDLDIAVAVQPAQVSGPSVCGDASPTSPSARGPGPFWKYMTCDGGLDDADTPGANAWLDQLDGGSQVAVAIFRSTAGEGGRAFTDAPTQSFSYVAPKKANPPAPIGATSVDFGDFDGDGKLDLAVGGGIFPDYSVPVTILHNVGGGALQGGQAVWHSAEQLLALSVRFVDWDGDGLADLLVTGVSPQWGFIYRGNAGPSLSTTATISTSGLSKSMHCAAVLATDSLGTTTVPLIAGAVNAKAAVGPLDASPPPVALVQQQAQLVVTVPGTPLASAVRFADLDGDGQLDMLLPEWTPAPGPEPVAPGQLYCDDHLLDAGVLRSLPGDAILTEGVAVGDLDNRARRSGSFTPGCTSAARRYAIAISDPRLEAVTGVTLNGQALSFAAAPSSRIVYVTGGYACAAPPTVQYEYSESPDIVAIDGRCQTPLSVFMHN
jgi:hypothetical protein